MRAFNSSSSLTRRLSRRPSSSNSLTICNWVLNFWRLLRRDLRDDSLLRIRRKSLLLLLLFLELERLVLEADGVDGPASLSE